MGSGSSYRTVFQILLCHVRYAGEIIPREDLYAELSTESTYDYKHGLNNAIQKIRDILGDSPDNALFIETVPGHSYRFLPHVEVVNKPSVRASNRIQNSEGDLFNSVIVERKPGPEVAHVSEVSRVPAGATALGDSTLGVQSALLSLKQSPAKRGTRKGWLRFCAIALFVIVALLAVSYFRWSVKPGGKIMLVVVSFLNLTGDPSQEYMADG